MLNELTNATEIELEKEFNKDELMKNDAFISSSKLNKLRHKIAFKCITYNFKYRYKSNHYHKNDLLKRKRKKKLNLMDNLARHSTLKVKMSNRSTNKLKNRLKDKLISRSICKSNFSSTTRSAVRSAYKFYQTKTSLIKNSRLFVNKLNLVSYKSIKKKLPSNQVSNKNKNSIKNVIQKNKSIKQQQQFTVSSLLFLILILIGQFLFNQNKVFALDTCLEHCNCIYSKNKFQADCSALALDTLPIVSIIQYHLIIDKFC